MGPGNIPSRSEDAVGTPPEVRPPPRTAPETPILPRRSAAREEDQRWAVPGHLLAEESFPESDTAAPLPPEADVPPAPARPGSVVIPENDQPTTFLNFSSTRLAPTPPTEPTPPAAPGPPPGLAPPGEPTLFLVKEDIAAEPRLRRDRNSRRRRVSAPLQPWADATPDDLALASQAVQRPMSSGRRIAVVAAAGGCGATSTAVTLGSIMGGLRTDRIALVGAAPDRGSMRRRLGDTHSIHLEELLAQRDAVQLGQAGVDLLGVAARFAAVLPPEESMVPAIAGDLVESLSRTRAVTIIDLGCARPDSGAAMILRDVHAATVITAPSMDGVESCRATLDRVRRGGVPALRIRAVVVETGRRTGMTAEAAAQQLSDTGVPVLTAPEDPHLAMGGPIDISKLSEATHMALTVLAASLLDASDGRFESFASEA
ncbi:MinD/ParA family ATP-binding protein [Austwickia chelonae]|uniref:MinD/ParA family ATP-binding protein n=1 Tax=Austwickia chelonae TaxID=100225 RepID=UPI0013C35937|nr:hypothetical protein [Austwickia chelonae]